MVAPSGTEAPRFSVRMAVAIGPASTTRWSEVTLPAGPALGWLVPVRPGATVDWAPSAWLGALDAATAPRVLVPADPAPCSLLQSFETPARWVVPGATLSPGAIELPATVADVGTWAQGHGLAVSAAEMKRLGDLYAAGWRVAAVELAASEATRSSPTLRVTDDGGAILPFSIGVSGFETDVTLFVVGAGTASLAGAREISDASVRWGADGSSYLTVRQQLVGGDGWVRESSSHEALFTEVVVAPRPSVAPVVVAPVSATYSGNDWSLALAGIVAEDAVLTRLAGALPAGRAAGMPEIAVAPGTSQSAVRRATSYDHPCPATGVDVDPPSETAPAPSSGMRQPSSPSGGSSYVPPANGSNGSTTVYVPSDGCSGGTTTAVEGDDDDDTWSSSSSSGDDDDSCSGDTSSSSSSDTSSDGWDSSDSNDACSGDSTSSSSDGWDKSDSSCATARHGRRRGSSPLSRVILLAAALLIPLRRLSRQRSGGRS